MKLAINGSSTMPYTLSEDIIAAGKAGFDAVEIWYPKLLKHLETEPLDHIKDLLQQYHLQIATLCPTVINAFDDRDSSLQAFKVAVDLAVDLGCKTLLTGAQRSPSGMYVSEAIKVFCEAADAFVGYAEDHGIRVALEPIGLHSFLDGPAAALEINERINRSNFGLMIDTFHYYKSNISMTDIEAIPVNKIFVIHVNDCEDLPKSQLQDKDRLYPTLGIIPAVKMLSPVVVKGYDGMLSVEVFRPSYWDMPIDEINRDAFIYGNQLRDLLVATISR